MDNKVKTEKNFNYEVPIPLGIVNSGYVLSNGAIRVWLVLRYFAHTTPVPCPSREKIGEMAGFSVQQVTKYIQELKDTGLIEIIRKQRRVGFGIYNEYILNNVENWWKEIGGKMKKAEKEKRQKKYGNNFPTG